MNKLRHHTLALTLILGVLCLINSNSACAESLWVDASRLVLRSEARPDGPVLGYLVANTKVEREEVQGPWCRVRSSEKTGFVACRFLAPAPVQRNALREKLKNGLSRTERLDVLQKLFWIKPSIDAIYDYGNALDEALLTEEDRAREIDTRLPRPARPEFEAMKSRLLQGVETPQVSLVSEYPLASPQVLALLPKVRASAFGNMGPVTLMDFSANATDGGQGVADAESILGVTTGHTAEILTWLANARQPPPALVRPVRFGPPQAQHYGGFSGAWDIGGIEFSMPAPGLDVLAFATDGSSQLTTITAFDTREASPGIGCDRISQFVLSRWSDSPDTKWLAALLNPDIRGTFKPKAVARSKPAAVGGWAKALLKRVKLESKDAMVSGGTGFMVAFDLNGDSVADVAYIGFEVSDGELLQGTVFDQYFNLAGRWHLAGEHTPQICGC